MKENFDTSIERLKEAHSKDVGELQSEIQRQRERAYESDRRNRSLEGEFDEKMKLAGDDMENMRESIRNNRRLHELQIDENKRMGRALEEYKKENAILTKEISILDAETNRLRQDNDDLRSSVIRLDRLV